MLTEHINIINKHITSLEFEDVYAFALNQLIKLKHGQQRENEDAISGFEEKYGMMYQTFSEQFHDIEGELFEKEEDDMEWEVRLHMRKTLESNLGELNQILLKSSHQHEEE